MNSVSASQETHRKNGSQAFGWSCSHWCKGSSDGLKGDLSLTVNCPWILITLLQWYGIGRLVVCKTRTEQLCIRTRTVESVCRTRTEQWCIRTRKGQRKKRVVCSKGQKGTDSACNDGPRSWYDKYWHVPEHKDYYVELQPLTTVSNEWWVLPDGEQPQCPSLQ